jgi:hypothetical protein
LFGWGNRTISTYSDVQSIHELAHVGFTYDLMFPNLTFTEISLLSKQYHDICQAVTSLADTSPDLDNDSSIVGDNGKGFGSGIATFCYSILGNYPSNPTMIQQRSTQYWGKNIPDEWMDREVSYMRSYKNDSWSKYQERIHYKFYSQFHLVEAIWFEQRFGLNNIAQFQNAINAMAREIITDILDFNYNGLALRNDENRNLRMI